MYIWTWVPQLSLCGEFGLSDCNNVTPELVGLFLKLAWAPAHGRTQWPDGSTGPAHNSNLFLVAHLDAPDAEDRLSMTCPYSPSNKTCFSFCLRIWSIAQTMLAFPSDRLLRLRLCLHDLICTQVGYACAWDGRLEGSTRERNDSSLRLPVPSSEAWHCLSGDHQASFLC